MGLFLSLPWSPELSLVSYNPEELDLEPGKEGNKVHVWVAWSSYYYLITEELPKRFLILSSCSVWRNKLLPSSCSLSLYYPLKTEDSGLAVSRG